MCGQQLQCIFCNLEWIVANILVMIIMASCRTGLWSLCLEFMNKASVINVQPMINFLFHIHEHFFLHFCFTLCGTVFSELISFDSSGQYIMEWVFWFASGLIVINIMIYESYTWWHWYITWTQLLFWVEFFQILKKLLKH